MGPPGPSERFPGRHCPLLPLRRYLRHDLGPNILGLRVRDFPVGDSRQSRLPQHGFELDVELRDWLRGSTFDMEHQLEDVHDLRLVEHSGLHPRVLRSAGDERQDVGRDGRCVRCEQAAVGEEVQRKQTGCHPEGYREWRSQDHATHRAQRFELHLGGVGYTIVQWKRGVLELGGENPKDIPRNAKFGYSLRRSGHDAET